MKRCSYCGYSNYDGAEQCRKCEASFTRQAATFATKTFWYGPEKARTLRRRAIALFMLGALMKVYWGGHGPWQAIDNPTLVSIRGWVEPLLLVGGALLYVAGWLLRWC
jgi:hypothetical protein